MAHLGPKSAKGSYSSAIHHQRRLEQGMAFGVKGMMRSLVQVLILSTYLARLAPSSPTFVGPAGQVIKRQNGFDEDPTEPRTPRDIPEARRQKAVDICAIGCWGHWLETRRSEAKRGVSEEQLKEVDRVVEEECTTVCSKKHSTHKRVVTPSQSPSELWEEMKRRRGADGWTDGLFRTMVNQEDANRQGSDEPGGPASAVDRCKQMPASNPVSCLGSCAH
ncbi:MAG: hypothetical protein M1816_005382 [Peltula sp. TS41687]|nr:MAG: hypothetical protein M1816_005382 [Peltula sp. TS41687]